MTDSIENKELTSLSRLHFLIHPGYIGDPKIRGYFNGEEVSAAESFITAETLKRMLEAKYVKCATQLQDDECMILFTHGRRKKLKEDYKTDQSYVVLIRVLKKILGDRLIVLSQNSYDQLPYFSFELQQMLKARGYSYNSDTRSTAYGELMDNCVPRYSDSLNRGLRLKHPTSVLLSETDFSGLPHEIQQSQTFEYILEHIRSKFDRVEFIR